jgi:hypothetical protein
MKYVVDIMEHREKRAVAEAIEKLRADLDVDRDKTREKDRVAIRKEVLGEVNGGSKGKIDTGSGSKGSSGTNFQEILSWPEEQRVEWRKQHPDAYNRAVSDSRNGH